MLSILISPAMFELVVADYTPHFEARAKRPQIYAPLKKTHIIATKKRSPYETMSAAAKYCITS